jgi:hypothetical protein
MRVSQNHAADRMFVSRNIIGSGKGINKANAIVMSTATEIGVLRFQEASLYLDAGQPPPPPIAFLNISAKKPPSAPAGIAAAKDKAMNHSGSAESP